MTGKTHMIIGTTAGVFAAVHYPLESGLILVASSLFASLIPDIDHPKSKINQEVLPVHNKFFKVLIYLALGGAFLFLSTQIDFPAIRLLGVTLMITGLSHHRGFTHSLLGALFFTAIAYLGARDYGLAAVYIGFGIGYGSHLLADYFTHGGIELFFPYAKNFSFPFTVRTGGWMEKFLAIGAGCLLIYILVQTFIKDLYW